MLNVATQRLRDTGEIASDMVLWGEGAQKRAVTDELTGDISGAGSVNYYGNPLVKTNSSGLGSFKAMGNK